MLDLYNMKLARELLDGRYQLTERIGGGGFSEVWLAHDTRSDIDVALKVYVSSQGVDEEDEAQFREDFAFACSFNHTNILKPFTYDICQDVPYIVLPYCENGSASKLVGKMTEDELWDFVGQVADGLSYIHKRNTVHRDIKPANILINTDNQYLITDFGISTKLRNTIRKTTGQNISPGSGTMAYMSYECLSSTPIDVIARDIWALGATLYEMATGDVPFGECGGLNQGVEHGKIPKITKDFSDDLKTIIYRCLAFNAWDRPSAAEIVEMVNAHKRGIRIKRQVNMKRRLFGISGAAAAVILLCVIGLKVLLPYPSYNPINKNDSILLSQIAEANAIVRKEKVKFDADPKSVDEHNLCSAARLYSSAISMDATDTVVDKGKLMWAESQDVINKAYKYLKEQSDDYYSIEAEAAAKTYLERSNTLIKYVSGKIEQAVNTVRQPRINEDLRPDKTEPIK